MTRGYQNTAVTLLRHCENMGSSIMTRQSARFLMQKHKLSLTPSIVGEAERYGLLARLPEMGALCMADTGAGAARVARWVLGRGKGASPGQRPLSAALSASQRAACIAFYAHGDLILTGGPGTGKTFTVSEIIKSLSDKRWAACALSGKAASVLTHAFKKAGVDLVARTIHSTIGLRPGKDQRPSYDKWTPLEVDYIVIDEFSMCDTALAGHLLDAIGPETGVIFCGDPDQIYSVGPGKVLTDLIESKLLPAVQLRETHRQSDGSGILTFADCMRKGIAPPRDIPNVHYWNVDPKNIVDKASSWLTSDYLKQFGREHIKDSIVISPVKDRKFQHSIAHINDRVSAHYSGIPVSKNIRMGDRIMFNVNDYEHGFVNGELGTLLSHGPHGTIIKNDFGEEYHLDKYKLSTSAELAYAMTAHKSQGSECDYVMLIFGDGAGHMYTRNIVYTAATRAKKDLFIIGNLNLLDRSVKRVQKRNTLLGLMLKDESLISYIENATEPSNLGKTWKELGGMDLDVEDLI